MPLSLHVAHGNTRRVAGRKKPAKLPARVSELRLGRFTRTLSAVSQYMNRAGKCVTISRRLEKQPITESPTMRSFVFKFNTIPVAFKAIRCSRRAQLWHRQASIIMDLTTLAVRHGWHSLACRSYDHRRSFESIGAVHGRVMQTATKLGV